MKAAAVILAGGASRRMGGSPKALLEFMGVTFIDRLAGIFAPHCGEVVVVLGYHANLIRSGMRCAATVAVNPQPELGQLSSLQCGFRQLSPDIDRVFFTPVDYPGIRPETPGALLRAADSGIHAIVPAYRGDHGHPVLVSSQLVSELLALPPDATARDVMHGHRRETRYVEVDDPYILADVDDAEAYRALTEAYG